MKKLFVFSFILFNANFAFGYITEDFIGKCDINANTIYAYFTPISYTCDSGEFLPADTLGCVACPSGKTCNGGNFSFNEQFARGITNNQPTTQNQTNLCSGGYRKASAKFQVNEYTCDAGYYLPAGNDWLNDNGGCVLCPVDSYCGGGIFTYSDTVPQGIVLCDGGLHAPTGMWDATQCGREVHIGEIIVYLHSVKKTSPALHVRVGDTIYYGNMTTADVPMSRGTQRKLKLRFNDTTYSVYDDSVVLSEP